MVAGPRAQSKVVETINGSGNYGFILFAINDRIDLSAFNTDFESLSFDVEGNSVTIDAGQCVITVDGGQQLEAGHFLF